MAENPAHVAKFKEVSKSSIDNQCKFFLNRALGLTATRQYMAEFEGKFEEVLAQSEVFRKIAASEDAKGKDNNASELNEVEFLRFLGTQDRTMTRDQMRKTFAAVDFDKSKGISFIEWLMFNYSKTLGDLMTEPDPLPADLRAELDKAIDEYQAAMAEERVFTDRIAELEAIAAAGGVKGNAAKAELETVKNKYSAEKVRIEKIKLAAEKKRRLSQNKANTFAAQAAADKEAALRAEINAKSDNDKAAKEAEAKARADKKAALNAQWTK